jgi:O-acetyl-ADP-ribose deacetylase (regulator of RNase III)
MSRHQSIQLGDLNGMKKKLRAVSKALTGVAALVLVVAACGKEEARAVEVVEMKYPELQMISSQGTTYLKEVAQEKMLPRGSAMLTESGNLKDKNITAIIHAASGSMTNRDEAFRPSEEGVKQSISNSIILAKRFKHSRIAIPFVGGGIFRSYMKASAEELASIIIHAAVESRDQLEVRFVMINDHDFGVFQKELAKLTANPKFQSIGTAVKVVKGSLTEFSDHGATAIVNGANMEVTFGGGISGAIANAVGKDRIKIDSYAREKIAEFNEKLLKVLN